MVEENLVEALLAKGVVRLLHEEHMAVLQLQSSDPSRVDVDRLCHVPSMPWVRRFPRGTSFKLALMHCVHPLAAIIEEPALSGAIRPVTEVTVKGTDALQDYIAQHVVVQYQMLVKE